ncbi:MAG: hypothetical protein JW778_04195 [Candidatus Altiarchaeota archaeon]|nr:hypothetical protein [Candidatus Altiarchaeota archaeon]
MISASPHVIRNMSLVLGREDLIESKKTFEKFLSRYENDHELREIGDVLMTYLSTRDQKTLGRIRSDLEELKERRRLESRGRMKRGRSTMMQLITLA